MHSKIDIAVVLLFAIIIYAHGTSTVAGSVTPVILPQPQIPTLTLSNTLIDQGQSILFTATVPSNGIGPYTYNFQIVNSITRVAAANGLFTGVVSGTDSFLWTPQPDLYAGNTFEANVSVTDSHPTTTNTTYYPIGYNSMPSITIAPSSLSLTSGQMESFVISTSGGTGPFNVELYNITGASQQGANVIISLPGGSNIISFVAGAVGSFSYNATASDIGATTPYVVNSLQSSIVVSPQQHSGGSGSGGSGVPSPPPPVPIVTTLPNGCLLATNLSISGSFQVSLDGYGIAVIDSYVVLNYTGIIVNGKGYTLSQGASVQLDGLPVSAQLLNVSSSNEASIELCYQSTSTATSTASGYSYLPTIAFTSAPLYTSLTVGTNYTSQLSISDTGTVPEMVNISISSNLSDIVSLGTTSLYVTSGQSAGTPITIHASNYLPAGVYIVPINFSISSSAGTATQQEFLTIAVFANTSDQPTILNKVGIVNYTNSSTGSVLMGTIEIKSPSNSSLSNATLETLLPISLVNNISRISTYGLPSNISLQNGSYVISWHISYLPTGHVTYAHYTITKPKNQPPISRIQNLLSVPTPGRLQLSNFLKVLNISIPIFYTGTTSHLYLQTLYTGASPGEVNFTLEIPNVNGIKGTTVVNIVNATPGQYITQNFLITTPTQSGTALLTLYVSANGASTTYTLPIVIMGTPPASNGLVNGIASNALYIFAAALVAVALSAAYLRMRRIRKGRRGRRIGLDELELREAKRQIDNGSGRHGG